MNLLSEGDLINQIINKDQPFFNLKGMICPTFQNLGATDVLFNGLVLKQGDSYSVNVPTVVLNNKVDIRFMDAAERKLVVSFVRLSQ